MFDDLFDIGDFADFGDVETVADVGDVADAGEIVDFGDVTIAEPDLGGADMFGDDLSYDNSFFDDAAYDAAVAEGDASWSGSEPAWDFADQSGGQYGSPIGPGLNGTPASPYGTADGGLFGGVKSALASIFTGNPATAAQRANSTVYGRQVLVRGPDGNMYYATGAQSQQSALQRLSNSLFGNGSAGRATSSRGIFGGSDQTTMFMVAGVALLGVALLAKR